jgi:hypothetical protein
LQLGGLVISCRCHQSSIVLHSYSYAFILTRTLFICIFHYIRSFSLTYFSTSAFFPFIYLITITRRDWRENNMNDISTPTTAIPISNAKTPTESNTAAHPTVNDKPMFSPSLISADVTSQLPEGYSMRPLRRTDYNDGPLDPRLEDHTAALLSPFMYRHSGRELTVTQASFLPYEY